ncbi:MAG: site-specific integrase [Planctomycetota bacterium]
MKAWTFQDPKQRKKLGPKKCPWSVGWYDQCGRKKQKTVGSKTAAKTVARRLEGEFAAGLLRDREQVKWAEFVGRFDRDHLATLAPKTREMYRRSLAAFTDTFGKRLVEKLTEADVAHFRAARLSQGVAPATVNKDLRHLRCALNKAKRWRLLPHAIEVELLREPERDPEFIDDEAFAKLYDACDVMKRPRGRVYAAGDWWRSLLTFAYLTGWRIGEIMALRRDNIDWSAGIAFVPAEQTKGKRDARVELHPVVVDHLRGIIGFGDLVFDWPFHERMLWADFRTLKKAADVEISGAFHRFRFGFANANVDNLDADVLQRLMRHQDAKTTRHYVNMAERMKRQGTAERLHVPAVLAKKA